MKPPDSKKAQEREFRAQPESAIATNAASTVRPADELLHELQVHQIELEMQNESLLQTRLELEASRDQYLDLYEFAPVGFLTLDTAGQIAQINPAAITLLGSERKNLLRRNFITRVLAEDRPRWASFLMRLNAEAGEGCVELAIQRGDDTVFQARLDCGCGRRRKVGAGDTAILIVLRDISRGKAAEAAQTQQIEALERFNRIAVGRELVMIELKRQVNALSRELGREAPFVLDFVTRTGTEGDGTKDAGAMPPGELQGPPSD
jgi:PAS domain S-box-containing protein